MKTRYYIKNLPVRLPIDRTILYAFLLYHFKVEDLYLGISIAIGVIYWIVCLGLYFNQKGIEVDLKNADPATPNKVPFTKSMFQTKLEQMERSKKYGG